MKKCKTTKAVPRKFTSVTVDKAENGYLVAEYGSQHCSQITHVFETDAALFKFLRKRFCEGHK